MFIGLAGVFFFGTFLVIDTLNSRKRDNEVISEKNVNENAYNNKGNVIYEDLEDTGIFSENIENTE